MTHDALTARASMDNVPGLSARKTFQRDTFDVAITLLTAASSSGQQCDGTVLYAMLIA